MARNVAQFGRRELYAHRRFVTGITASVPAYKEMDIAGHKEWVVDVYIGPLETLTANVIKDVPIADVAKNLVTDMRKPVLLERSKQGKYTVIGRAKEIPSGAQMPDETILEPTYNEVKHNLADLRLLFIADLDFELEPLQEDPDLITGTELQADPEEPLQVVRATNAFGRPVLGPDAENPPPLLDPVPASTTKTRHVVITPAKFGPYGDPLAMKWGDPDSVLQPMLQVVVELEE